MITLALSMTLFSLFLHDVEAQEATNKKHAMAGQKAQHTMPMKHNAKAAKHNPAGGGGHGMVVQGLDKFPTTAYQGSPETRPIEKVKAPSMQGNVSKGKKLAASPVGRCLTCHVLDQDGKQPGNVGPNLSNFANLNRSDDYIFQQIWDARAHNPQTLMPPMGTNELLSKHQIIHIVAYLKTLKTPITADVRASKDKLNLLVAGRDFTLADTYIEQGEAIFNKAGKNGKSCASYHQQDSNSLAAVAATFPKANTDGQIINLEQQVNVCRQTRMDSHPFKLGSAHSNQVISYVKFLSRDVPINVVTNEIERAAVIRGEELYSKKAGQLNFSCADCHAKADDKWLRGQYLSSIKPTGTYSSTAATWPRHFIAGHDLGLISLQQRIRHCQVVSRTHPLKLGSKEYTDIELYLTSLANSEPMLAPTKSNLDLQ